MTKLSQTQWIVQETTSRSWHTTSRNLPELSSREAEASRCRGVVAILRLSYNHRWHIFIWVVAQIRQNSITRVCVYCFNNIFSPFNSVTTYIYCLHVTFGLLIQSIFVLRSSCSCSWLVLVLSFFLPCEAKKNVMLPLHYGETILCTLWLDRHYFITIHLVFWIFEMHSQFMMRSNKVERNSRSLEYKVGWYMC